MSVRTCVVCGDEGAPLDSKLWVTAGYAIGPCDSGGDAEATAILLNDC